MHSWSLTYCCHPALAAAALHLSLPVTEAGQPGQRWHPQAWQIERVGPHPFRPPSYRLRPAQLPVLVQANLEPNPS